MNKAVRSVKSGKVRNYYDYGLLFVILFLACFGLIMIYSTSYYAADLNTGDGAYFMKRQATVLLVGFIGMIGVSKLDYHLIARLAVIGYYTSIFLMFLTNFTSIGIERNGKKRWIGISETLSFQTAEIVKIAIILYTAYYIINNLKKIDELKTMLFLLLRISIPGLLVLMNNLSSGIIIFGIAFMMYFIASRRRKEFLYFIVGIIALAAAAVLIGDKLVSVGIIKEYQWERILVWQNPETYAQEGGFQVLQGLYAIGSGGLFGKGLGNSTQKLGFVPEAQNDMIFSIICEELGLFGAVCVMLLFLFMLYRFMVIANNAPDLLGGLIVSGVTAHIAIQVILNIAVVTNTIPNTGITLPFISYGGTSLLFLMIEMGLVLGVSNRIRIEL